MKTLWFMRSSNDYIRVAKTEKALHAGGGYHALLCIEDFVLLLGIKPRKRKPFRMKIGRLT